MAAKTTEAERRSKVAEVCLDFGSHLLRVRISTVTASEAQELVKELFDWFASQNAFNEENFGIAIHAVQFGEELLASRKTATVPESIDAIQKLYLDLSD